MADNDDFITNDEHLESLDDTNGLLNMTDNSQQDGKGGSESAEGMEDPELADIKARVREMEEEAERLKQLQSENDKAMISPPGLTSPLSMSLEEKIEVDNRSVYVGNVDYGATAEELEQHFHGCGSINRVTILCNRFDGHPKGFAYIEFGDKDSVQTAMAMDESLFRGRQIKVNPKRTNKPGLTSSNRIPRGMRIRGRGTRGLMSGGGYYRPARRARFSQYPTHTPYAAYDAPYQPYQSYPGMEFE